MELLRSRTFLLVTMLLVLTACAPAELPEEASQPNLGEPPAFPVCNFDDIEPTNLNGEFWTGDVETYPDEIRPCMWGNKGCSPKNGVLLDPEINVTFTWDNPLAAHCSHDGYKFQLFFIPSYEELEPHGGVFQAEQFLSMGEESFTLPFDLQSNALYMWRIILTTDNPLQDPSWNHFRTGPECASNVLQAPDYSKGPDGNNEEVTFHIVEFDHPAEDCLPLAYEYQLTTDPGMGGPYINTFVGGSHSLVKTPLTTDQYDSPIEELEECTQYYWRARAVASDGSGPWGEVVSFMTGQGTNLPCGEGDSSAEEDQAESDGEMPYAVAIQNSNCRASDFAEAQNVGTLFEGEMASILAINPGGTHVRIQEPTFDVRCWIFVDLVELIYMGEAIMPDDLLGLVDVFSGPPAAEAPPQDGGGEDSSEDSDDEGEESNGGAPPTQCNDGIDNDGDGKADYDDSAGAVYLGDLQCSSFADDDEAN